VTKNPMSSRRSPSIANMGATKGQRRQMSSFFSDIDEVDLEGFLFIEHLRCKRFHFSTQDVTDGEAR